MVYNCDDCLRNDDYSWSVTYQDLTYIDSYLTFDLSQQQSMMEIALPTCSYRMGVSHMGYGVAIIGEHLKLLTDFTIYLTSLTSLWIDFWWKELTWFVFSITKCVSFWYIYLSYYSIFCSVCAHLHSQVDVMPMFILDIVIDW